jgi:hypothetical protein
MTTKFSFHAFFFCYYVTAVPSLVLQSTQKQHLNSIRSFLFFYPSLSSYLPSSGRKWQNEKCRRRSTHQDDDLSANYALIEKLQEAEWWILHWTGSDHIPNANHLILCWYALVKIRCKKFETSLINWSSALRWQTCVLFECSLTMEIFIAPYGGRGKSGSTHQNYKMVVIKCCLSFHFY